MMTIEQIKQRFGIIGHSEQLNRAIDIAVQVAPTDLSVLITGESGSGKENIPQIIHQLSARKHNKYIAVNCGAIPEGTIDSELFGHEKGSFTGATETRKGYFEVADGGTIFLDEVAELPLTTQVRLLRVLETGEFLKVGSSKPQKTNVRITAATNVNIPKAINENKFREDLFYRLNTVPIEVPPLRVRKDDIHLLFRKFSADFADKYRMPSVQLTEEARVLLLKYRWPGNVRQLKNVTEQISVIEKNKLITAEVLLNYLPENSEASLPVIYSGDKKGMTERDILYKVLFDMKKDVADLKKVVFQVIKSDSKPNKDEINHQVFERLYGGQDSISSLEKRLEIAQFNENKPLQRNSSNFRDDAVTYKKDISEEKDDYQEIVIEQEEESLSISDTEQKLIKKALQKHGGKRKYAAEDLGISERTLYRKIKEYDIEQ
ncbi:sigma-54 dependent transcriptional regulator [Vicingaceae bacterium]|nr:sigma-54 dependent transcriptional regulator [Vicingaceae bacterium]